MWPISDDQLRDVLRNLPVAIYQETHEPEPRLTYLSPNAEVVLGADADAHLHDPDLWWRSIDPRDHDAVTAAWDLAYRTGQPYSVDYRYRHPDGRTVWLRDEETPVRDQGGSVTHWQGLLLDVTAERTARDELTASEARYRDLVEHLPAAVYTLSVDDPPRVLYISEAIEEVCGYEVERWLEDPELAMSIVHPDDHDDVLAAWVDARRTGLPFERSYRVSHADGTYRRIAERIHPIHRHGEVVGWEGMTFDVTREHETATALKESEARHERLLQQIPGIAFSLLAAPTREFDYMSPRVQDILGYPRSLWFEEPGFWQETIHPDDRAAVVREWDRCTDTGEAFRMEYRVLHQDGQVVWLRAETLPTRGADGEIERWQGLWLDITEARAARAEQQRLETRYQRLVEQAPAIVFTTDPSGAVEYVGPQVEDILGYPAAAWGNDPLFSDSLVHPDDRDRVIDGWREASEAGRPYEAEYRLRRADGVYRWVHETSHPVRDDRGEVTSWRGITVDVHELHVAREAREAAEARAEALLENVPAVVYEMGPDDERRTLYVSPHIERLLGYSRQEWLDQPDIWTELLHPDDREIELDAHDQHSSSGEPWAREYRLVAADGQVVWVRDQAALAVTGDGSTVWQGVLVDVTSQHVTAELLQITNEELERRISERTAALEEANELMGLEVEERRRAEKEAARAKERYRVLVENMPAVAYIWRTAAHAQEYPDADYYMSPRLEDILGYTPQEWHDQACWIERLHPHDRDAVVAEMLRCEETGDPFEMEFRYFAKDGRIVWIEDHGSLLSRLPDGRPAMFHGVLLDVTARKEAEAQAVAALERYRQLAEEGPFAIYVFSLDDDPPVPTVEALSGQLSAILGQDAADRIERPERWLELVHPDDRGRAIKEHQEQWQTGQPLESDYRMIAADGRIVWLRDRCRCLERDEQGRPVRFLGTLMDVTDEVEAMVAMSEELTRLRTIVEGLPATTWIMTDTVGATDPRYVYFSPQVEGLTGYTPEELVAEAQHFHRLLHPDDRARVDRAWRDTCRSGAETWEERWRLRHRDGTVRWVHGTARRVSEPGTTPIVWVGVSTEVPDATEGDRAAPGADAVRI